LHVVQASWLPSLGTTGEGEKEKRERKEEGKKKEEKKVRVRAIMTAEKKGEYRSTSPLPLSHLGIRGLVAAYPCTRLMKRFP